MSVHMMERSQSSAEYLNKLSELAKWAMRIEILKPNKYKKRIEKDITDPIMYAYRCACSANSIYPSPKHPTDLEMRHNYLTAAHSAIKGVGSMIRFYHDVLGGDCLSIKDVERYGEMCVTCLSMLKGVMKSDDERYKKSCAVEDTTQSS